MKKPADDIKDLIETHLAQRVTTGEKAAVERARAYLRGDFLGKMWREERSENAAKFFTAKNLIYAITDSAVTGLIGDNPKIAVQGENPDSCALEGIVNGRLNKVFDANEVRESCVLSLTDAVTVGRAVFKTKWSRVNWLRRANMQPDLAMPSISAPDPIAVFFDSAVRLRRDVTYYLECTPIRKRELERRAKGSYNKKAVSRMTDGQYPQWLKDSKRSPGYTPDSRYMSWYTVWEFYDLYDQKVYHYAPDAHEVLLEADLDFPVPYSIYNLNHNGVDLLGLSEAQLILGIQETINDLLTLLNEITYGQLPRVGYDASQIDPDALKEWQRSPVGSFVPLPVGQPERVGRLQDLFYRFPYAEQPEGVIKMLEMLEDIAAFVSALADAARGQITNARTATEVAVMQAQMSNRLSGRRARLFDALKDVATKCIQLDRLYLPGAEWVRSAGRADLSRFDPTMLRTSQLEFALIPWNPIQQTPGVVVDSLINLYEYLAGSEAVDKDEYDRWLARGLGAPENVLRTQTELNDAREEMARQAGAIPAEGQMPNGPGPVPPATGMDALLGPPAVPETATRATPAATGDMAGQTGA